MRVRPGLRLDRRGDRCDHGLPRRGPGRPEERWLRWAGTREAIEAAGAPAAIGPYNHAISHGDLLFCSGQIPLDPGTGEIVGESAAEQARQCLRNLEAVCETAGTRLDRALRLTIYTTELERFEEINAAYAEFFADEHPARAAVGVAALPKGALVEIDAIVALD